MREKKRKLTTLISEHVINSDERYSSRAMILRSTTEVRSEVQKSYQTVAVWCKI